MDLILLKEQKKTGIVGYKLTLILIQQLIKVAGLSVSDNQLEVANKIIETLTEQKDSEEEVGDLKEESILNYYRKHYQQHIIRFN